MTNRLEEITRRKRVQPYNFDLEVGLSVACGVADHVGVAAVLIVFDLALASTM